MKTLLEKTIAQHGKDGLCIAFSGGVDSGLLLGIAAQLPIRVHAVTFATQLHPAVDLEAARAMAHELGVIHTILPIDELSDEGILMNPHDRCYRCKRLLFSKLREYAEEQGLGCVMDGTNADDLTEYRPGLRALAELKVVSPLAELGLHKSQVRELAQAMGMSIAQKPSSPCLATRLPYGTRITPQALAQIEQGESFLKDNGFQVCRLRVYGDTARIEILPDDFHRMMELREDVIQYIKGLGFSYVTLDLEGFRSGSMDVHINYGEVKYFGDKAAATACQRGKDEY
ncbi:MAG: ATP-dependent sacrificial sulfur transferase LarE [Candidatus Pararuminococcus gallinarum]|jgi:uncharacterized protein